MVYKLINRRPDYWQIDRSETYHFFICLYSLQADKIMLVLYNAQFFRGISQLSDSVLSCDIIAILRDIIIMNALQQSIQEAIHHQGSSQKANKAYLEFIKANLMMPIESFSDEKLPAPLYFQQGNETYLPVFSDKAVMEKWADDIKDKILLLTLSGVDLLKGIGDEVSICLDIGSDTYKLFNSSEVARMRSMVIKIFASP